MKSIPQSLSEIKTLNAGAGFHFFSKSTMRFFSSKAYSNSVYPASDCTYFVTSEQYSDHRGNREPRLYTVRRCTLDGTCETVGNFQEFSTLNKARTQAKRLAKGGVKND